MFHFRQFNAHNFGQKGNLCGPSETTICTTQQLLVCFTKAHSSPHTIGLNHRTGGEIDITPKWKYVQQNISIRISDTGTKNKENHTHLFRSKAKSMYEWMFWALNCINSFPGI